MSMPDIEMLMALSELYGVTINEIIQADTSEIKYKKEIHLLESGKKNKRVAVIGCGRWGTFISWYLDKIGHKVSLYGRKDSTKLMQLMKNRRNEQLILPDTVELTTELACCENVDIVVISVGAQQLSSLCSELQEMKMKNKILVLCMKGIEIDTGRRLSQVVSDALDASNKIAVWLGPGHVQDFYRGIPNCMVIDSTDALLKDEVIKMFSSELIRFYYGTDLIGNEIGAAAKNVIGIAAGMLEGLNLSSLKGALMTRGTKEISNLIVAMGGNEKTAYGLCLLGDYEATLFSEYSQNLNYGKCIVQNKKYSKLAEGYYTVKALHNLSRAYGVELPICETVFRILYNKKSASEELAGLFERSLKSEL